MQPASVSERARIAVERFSLRNLVIALVVGILLASVAAVLTLQGQEEYRSTALLLIDNPVALATLGDDAAVTKLESLRGKYATLADTEAIAGPVGDDLGIPFTEAAARTTVTTPTSTLTLIVSATGSEPQSTRELADRMAEEIGRYVEREHRENDVPEPNRFQISVVRDASPAVQTAPSDERAVSSAAIVFLMAVAAVYLVLQFARPPVAPGERLARSDEALDSP